MKIFLFLFILLLFVIPMNAQTNGVPIVSVNMTNSAINCTNLAVNASGDTTNVLGHFLEVTLDLHGGCSGGIVTNGVTITVAPK